MLAGVLVAGALVLAAGYLVGVGVWLVVREIGEGG